MARKPNYNFERQERDRAKALKVAQKAEDKRQAREQGRAQTAGEEEAPAADDE